ncbi:unnamed protein product [Effrenium voratum]|uniref:Uncharacterized protein n=1 Tax=Effrenium voratum TaxID=2562239 RepID=A0AA36JQ96_9DINO|nr:unnamed protein product [Effrenium voratum]
MRPRPWLLAAWATAGECADLRGKSDDFWTCAGDGVLWHRLRETVRYVMWTPSTPLRTSVEHVVPLLPLWMTLGTGHENRSKVAESAVCPAGEVFFMLLHFLMSQMEQVRFDGSIDMNGLVDALAMLRVRIPSMSAALRSTWPIFGLLALIQQQLLRLGKGSTAPSPSAPLTDKAAPFGEALRPFARICEEGLELFELLQAWLEAPGLLPGLPLSARSSAEVSGELPERGASASS